MTIVSRIVEFHDELTAIRRTIHAAPELLFEVHRTAGLVAEKLREYGVDEVVTGIGRTGVVGTIRGRTNMPGRTIGLRADMDALPITEDSGLDYASATPGIMHACGHDGHVAMLLGAARYLAETRNFDGTAVVIFQPAEEGGGGGREMVEAGLMERFGIDEVYGMHTFPNLPVGNFAIGKGAMLASVDTFEIHITGRGAHAAKPQASIDPIVIGAGIVQALQTIVSRSVDPVEALVISVTTFNAGSATNVIAQTAALTGTVRSLSAKVRDIAQKRLTEIVEGVAATYGGKVSLTYQRLYPVMSNHSEQTDIAADIAAGLVGKDNVNRNTPSSMGGEDFSFMLEARPGAMIFIGQGPSAELHHPQYDFNDQIIPIGASFWAKLVEARSAV